MKLNIHLPLDVHKVYELGEKAVAVALGYGMDWRSTQRYLDPDLHNPAMVHLLEDLQ